MITVDDVQIHALKQIFDERGKVMHMLRVDDPSFVKFGEIYFSVAHPGVVKGWHKHEKMTLNYACITGEVRLVVFDGINFKTFYLGKSNYDLITIPPGIWNGFKNVGDEDAVVANCSDIPHDPQEILRLDPHLPIVEGIPYSW